MKSYLSTTGSTNRKIEPFQGVVVTSPVNMLTLYTPVTVGLQRVLFFFKLIGRYPNATEQTWNNGTCYIKYNMNVNKHTIGYYILGLLSGTFLMLGVVQWGSLGFQLFPPGYL